MKKELIYFNIEDSYGGNQDWFIDPMMKLGGCAAATLCDLSIYFSIVRGSNHLYPYDKNSLSIHDYIKFSDIVKPYLHPRKWGIDTLKLYMDGAEKYLYDVNDKEIKMSPFSGEESVKEGKNLIIKQINKDIPVPFLLLKHKNENLKDIVWHWFLIVGYENSDDDFKVKIATYGRYNWISFEELWNTGYEKKGGMIIIDLLN